MTMSPRVLLQARHLYGSNTQYVLVIQFSFSFLLFLICCELNIAMHVSLCFIHCQAFLPCPDVYPPGLYTTTTSPAPPPPNPPRPFPPPPPPPPPPPYSFSNSSPYFFSLVTALLKTAPTFCTQQAASTPCTIQAVYVLYSIN